MKQLFSTNQLLQRLVIARQFSYIKLPIDFFNFLYLKKWNLVCDRDWYVSFTQSLYMAGMVISSLISGHFSDKYGRLPVLWTAVILELLGGLSCAFSFSIYQYMISRFILAIGAYGRYLSGFMLGKLNKLNFKSLIHLN